jgi:NTE family protein
MQPSFIRHDYQRELLENSLKEIFGEFSETMLRDIEPRMEWLELAGGETLFNQNESSDSLYFIISGRLRAFVQDENNVTTAVGDIIRGEMVGEMALYTGENRMATIKAVRDSVLVKLTKTVFDEVLQAYPLVSTNITRIVIQRLNQSQNKRNNQKKPVNICFIPISDGLDINPLVNEIYGLFQEKTPQLDKKNKVILLTSSEINTRHDKDDFAHSEIEQAEEYRKLSYWLDDQEAKHNFVFYLADSTDTEWTRRCVRLADEVYLFANANQDSQLSQLETSLFPENSTVIAPVNLVLLHEATTKSPTNTNKWLSLRNLKGHYHIRPSLSKDVERLARTLRGAANGLVLAGGGAKGFAHIGVYRALSEAGIPIDFVGGTSMGALMSVLIAFDLEPEIIEKTARQSALANPTKDYAIIPLISLIKGNRLERMIKEVIHNYVGLDLNIEDTWLPFFAVSSNYSQAKEEVHSNGPLFEALRASISIPGAFPPVVKGNDLLIDGGTFNNFPTNIMAKEGVGKIIGVDLSRDKIHKLNINKMPSGWELLKDKFKPKAKKKYRLPSLMSILLNTTVLYSTARQKDAKKYTDLFLNPDVSKFGLMDWQAFDKICAIGYNYAKEVLTQLPETELHDLKG